MATVARSSRADQGRLFITKVNCSVVTVSLALQKDCVLGLACGIGSSLGELHAGSGIGRLQSARFHWRGLLLRSSATGSSPTGTSPAKTRSQDWILHRSHERRALANGPGTI